MNKRTVIILSSVAAAAVIAVGGVLLRANYLRNYDAVFPGVTVEGTCLEGMTRQQVEDAIQGLIAKKAFAVTLSTPDGETCTIAPEQTVAELDPGAALDAAWNFGRSEAGFFGPMRAYGGAKKGATEIPLEYRLEYDAADLTAQVDAFLAEVSEEPTPCTGAVDQEAHTVTLTLGAEGRTLDRDAVLDATAAALEADETALALEYETIPLDAAQLQDLQQQLIREARSEPTETVADYDEANEQTVITVGTPGYFLEDGALESATEEAIARGEASVTLDLTPIPPKDYDLDALHDWVKRDPVEVYSLVNGDLEGGTPGYDFDLSAAREALDRASYGEVVAIPLDVTPPALSYEEAWNVLFRDRLSSCDTYHTGESNRTHNLILACEALNGTIINPGEEFSFNGTVGERTADKGYRTGIVYVNNSQEPQLGGGICQVATGCYQAALKAGMEITHREEHMFPVTYCALGLDATVYWGSVDLSFRNPWSMPVRLNASVSGGQVHISIDGTNFTGMYIRLSSERVSAPAGHTAYRAYKTIYYADGTVYDTIDLGVSTYQNH